MLSRLNGISFAKLPHITKGEEVIVLRENGEIWDSEARPAYSVRLGCMHIGYIPLVETLKEEALKARDGFRKVWKHEFASLSKDELRKVAAELNRSGKVEKMSDWEFVGKDEMRETSRNKMREAENTEVVRDWLYTEIMRNHLTPQCTVIPIYFDKNHGRNFDEIGDICSLSVRFDDIW